MSDHADVLGQIQHKQIEKDLAAHTKRIDEQYEAWERFCANQEQIRVAQEERFFSKLEELRQGIDRKSELDGVLLAKMRELSARVEYLAGKKEKSDSAQTRLMVYFRDIRDLLTDVDVRKMKADVQAAHDWKREHIEHHEKTLEPRIEELSHRSGKTATRILWGIGLPVGGGLLLWLGQKLFAFLASLGGAP